MEFCACATTKHSNKMSVVFFVSLSKTILDICLYWLLGWEFISIIIPTNGHEETYRMWHWGNVQYPGISSTLFRVNPDLKSGLNPESILDIKPSAVESWWRRLRLYCAYFSSSMKQFCKRPNAIWKVLKRLVWYPIRSVISSYPFVCSLCYIWGADLLRFCC